MPCEIRKECEDYNSDNCLDFNGYKTGCFREKLEAQKPESVKSRSTDLVMPIMLGAGKRHGKKIPFSMLSEDQANTNHGQTLKRLAERGGLSPCEAIAIMEGRRWRHMDAKVSLELLIKRLEGVEA